MNRVYSFKRNLECLSLAKWIKPSENYYPYRHHTSIRLSIAFTIYQLLQTTSIYNKVQFNYSDAFVCIAHF